MSDLASELCDSEVVDIIHLSVDESKKICELLDLDIQIDMIMTFKQKSKGR